jgi:hypothetical protein
MLWRIKDYRNRGGCDQQVICVGVAMTMLNELYGVQGPLTPDYFDCKMLNDLAADLYQQAAEHLADARNLRRLIGLCRDVAARYHWQTKFTLALAAARRARAECARIRALAHQATEAYLDALSADQIREGVRRAA